MLGAADMAATEIAAADTTAVVIGCGPIGLKFVRMLSRRGEGGS